MIKVYWLYKDETDNIFKDGYVGISKNSKVRFYQHKKRFGEFKTKIIFYGSLEQCLALEFQLRPTPGIGWNKACGGFEGYRLGHSKETINLIKLKRATQIAPMSGKSHSEAAKTKIKNSNIGKIRSNETKARIKIAKQNISIETRAKQAIAATGRKLSAEGKAKVSQALKNRIRNPETAEKIKASVRAAWNNRRPPIDFSKMIHRETMALSDVDLEVKKG